VVVFFCGNYGCHLWQNFQLLILHDQLLF